MHHRAIIAAAAFVLVACDVPPTPVEPSLIASKELANAATTFTSNETFPISLVVFVSCANNGAGELVALTGSLHALFHVTISDAGNVHLKTHFQPQGVSGTGLATGDKYQGTGVTQEELHFNAPLPITDTFINNFRIIGQGPGNNFMVHQTFHITINANGEVTSVVDNFNVTCK